MGLLPIAAHEVDLVGVIDTHVHSAPDVRQRLMDDLDLARAAAARGMRALVLKSHHTLTADRAFLVERMVPGVRLFGGIVLNNPVGGLNPFAVDAALRMGALVVSMPTISAAVEPIPLGPPISVLREGHVKAEVHEILALVAEHDAVLATGHLDPAEIVELVPAARDAGVRKILITHPEHPPVLMDPLAQEELRQRFGVMFERCVVTSMSAGGSMDLSVLAGRIRRVGPASTILATDLGVAGLPAPADGMASYIAGLQALGFDSGEIDRMCRQNPAELLDLDP